MIKDFFKKGDVVMFWSHEDFGRGIVVETDVNMWGEEVVPSGVKVMWSNGEIETVYEDEITISDELSDEQLEIVAGGMNNQSFSNWRANYLNKKEI